MKSKHEEMLAGQLTAAGISFTREHQILPPRKWRADFFVWCPYDGRSAYVEVNGQGPQGRHGGFHHAASDAEKLSAIACLGYRVIVCTGPQVASGEALKWIRCALRIEGEPEGVFSKPKVKRSMAALQGGLGGRRERSPRLGHPRRGQPVGRVSETQGQEGGRARQLAAGELSQPPGARRPLAARSAVPGGGRGAEVEHRSNPRGHRPRAVPNRGNHQVHGLPERVLRAMKRAKAT